jgi:hypothetical protein
MLLDFFGIFIELSALNPPTAFFLNSNKMSSFVKKKQKKNLPSPPKPLAFSYGLTGAHSNLTNRTIKKLKKARDLVRVLGF